MDIAGLGSRYETDRYTEAMSARFYFKPFLIHLALSLLIAIACYWLVFMQWYPEPFQSSERVLRIFALLILVHMVAGPLLTLLIYKPGKKDLPFDMAVIVMLQGAALAYGIWSLEQARPAWLVFSVDRFEVVRRVDIDPRRIADAAPEFRNPATFSPSWAAARLPNNLHDRQVLLFESISGGADMANRPELYVGLDGQRGELERAIEPLERLQQFNDPQQVLQVLRLYPTATGWVPMTATHEDLVVLMDRATAGVVAVVQLSAYE